MYFVVLYVLLLVEYAFSGACNTPHNERGQCVPLVDCPKILDAMANSNPKNEEYLRKFICKTQSDFEVCCGIASDFTVNTDENEIPTCVGDSDIKIPVHYGIFCEHSLHQNDADKLPLTVSEIRVRNLKSDVEFTECVGLLLNPRYVLARASCLKKYKETYEFEIVGIGVQIGLVYANAFQTFGTEEKVIHPFYDETTGTNDIALLRLNTTINEDSPRICLPFRSPYKLEDIVAVYSTFETPSSNGTANNRTFFSNTECQQALKDKGLNITITNYEMCLKNDAGDTHNFCKESDKGWPLAVLRKYEKNFFVEGIPSAKTTCSTERHLVVYTNITTYTKWIKNNMKPWPYNEARCVMPHGETGYCCHLYQCPVLQEVFANPKKDSLQYLNKFICKRTNVYDKGILTSNFEHVCCSPSLNSTILKNHIIKHVGDIQNLPPEFLGSETCGLQHRDDYYSSDDVVTIDEFPWIAILLEIATNNESLFKSTGALINARYVVTSSLGVEDSSRALVRLGDFHRFNSTDCVQEFGIDAEDCSNSMDYEIEEVIPHPFYYSYHDNNEFSVSVFLNAIILVRLKRTVDFSDYIRPICLALLPETKFANIGDTLYMSTWSLNFDTEVKRKAPFVLVPQSECQPFPLEDLLNLNGCVKQLASETRFSCIDTAGVDTLMSHNNFKWHLEGMFVGDDTLLCTSGRNTYTYVNVSKYLDWIVENMQPWTSDEY